MTTKKKESWVEIDLNEITSYSLELKYMVPSWVETVKTKRFATLEEAVKQSNETWAKLLSLWWMIVTYENIKLKKLFIPLHKINFLQVYEIPPSEKHQDISWLLA